MNKGPYLCTPNKTGRLQKREGESRKIFERMETTVRKSSIYGKVMLAKNIDSMTVFFREKNDSQYQNSFTMESLILAQDER